MKEVNYICCDESFPIAKSVTEVFNKLKAMGFVPCEDLNRNMGKTEKRIYLDTPNRGAFARNLNTVGGFCRIVIEPDENEDFKYFVDYKATASSTAKRYSVGRVVSSKEIANQVGFRGKLVKIFETSCTDYNYFMKKITPKGNIMIKLDLQSVKVYGTDEFGERNFCFIGLNDRTRKRFGATNERNMELEINECFKMFAETIDRSVFKQVLNNKYCALLANIPELNNERNLPF
jgi:hypothetical protein